MNRGARHTVGRTPEALGQSQLEYRDAQADMLRRWAAWANSLADRLADAFPQGRTPSLDPWSFLLGSGSTEPGFGAAGPPPAPAGGPATMTLVDALDDDRVRRDVARIIAREIRDMENRGGF